MLARKKLIFKCYGNFYKTKSIKCIDTFPTVTKISLLTQI